MKIKNTQTLFMVLSVLFSCLFFFSLALAESTSGWNLKFAMSQDKTGLSLSGPASLFIDESAKRYYVVDTGNNRLVSYDYEGAPLQNFTGGGDLQRPVSMAKDPSGLLYVVDKGKGSFSIINLKNKSITPHVINHEGRRLITKKIRYLNGLLYVLDSVSGMIFAISDGDRVQTRFSCNSCVIGYADFQLAHDRLYAVKSSEGEVDIFNLKGEKEKAVVLVPKPQFPVSLAVNEIGEIFTVGRHTAEVAAYDTHGKLKYSFLERGEKLGNLNYPIEIQFDPWGRLCVVEEGNGRVSVFEQ